MIGFERARNWAMAAGAGIAVASIYYNQPMLGLIGADLPGRAAALIPAATQVGYAAGLVLLVPLGDLHDRRRLIVGQFVLLAGAMGLAAVAPSGVVMVVASLLAGLVATAAQQIVPFAADLAPVPRRGATVGIVMAGLLGGILFSRTLAGFVAVHGGWRAMFVLAAGLSLAGGGLSWAMLPREGAKPGLPYGRLLVSLVALWRRYPALRLAAVTQGLLFATFTTFWSVLAFRLAGAPFHLGAEVAGLFGVVGAAGIFAAPLAGRFADRHGAGRTVLLGAGLVAGSWGVLGVSGSIPVLAAGVVLLDFAIQGCLVSNQHIIFSLNAEARSRINTVFMSVMFVGGASGSALAMLAWAHGGWAAVSVLGLGCSLAAVGLQAVVRGRGS